MQSELKINTISLHDLLPNVFAGEEKPASRVWSTECAFQRGQHYLVEAPSGGGKSSLLGFIYGRRTDYQGTILFNDRDIRTFTVPDWQRLRQTHLAYVPQELNLFPELTCIENIMLKLSLTDCVEPSKIDEWLERLGIADRRNFPVGKMSIGQQQRVAIIRALAMPFDFLMLDEPVSHLDNANNLIVAEIIAEQAARYQAGVISTSVGNPLLLHSAINIRL